MANINSNNFAKADGNLASEPIFFDNSDGSRSVRLSIAYDESFVRKGSERGRRYIDLQDYITAENVAKGGNGVYDYLTKGSPVSVMFETYTKQIPGKDGAKPTYKVVSDIKDVQLRETNAQLKARKDRNAGGAQAPAAAAAAPVTQDAPVETVDPLA